MRFWIKIAMLCGATYLACYGSLLAQDRRDHKDVVRDVEAVTREACLHAGQGDPSLMIARLNVAQQRLNVADARWRRDASHLMLLASD